MKALIIACTVVTLSLCGPLHAEEDAGISGAFSMSLRNSVGDDAIHGELMMEGDLAQQMTVRGGLAFLLSEDTGIHGGFELGLRSRLPWRVAPFVGAGLFMGSWTDYERADYDGIDNDGDLSVDEVGEEEEHRDYLFALYPEAGVHLWLNETVRLTGSWRHYVTSKGPDSSRSLYGVGLALSF